MTTKRLENVNVAAFDLMPSPEEIQARAPISETAAESVFAGRETIRRILDRADPRLFIVVGPCSIHDLTAGYDYAQRLQRLADDVKDTLVLVMRVYFAKPRTATGWKGFINDPYLDDSFRIEEGMEKARAFLLQVAELGLPIATEALDSITPQYLGDLIAWTAIGARTAESQTHRELASGLSTPVGFKNGTDGDIQVAINGIRLAARPQSFLGLSAFCNVREAPACADECSVVIENRQADVVYPADLTIRTNNAKFKLSRGLCISDIMPVVGPETQVIRMNHVQHQVGFGIELFGVMTGDLLAGRRCV